MKDKALAAVIMAAWIVLNFWAWLQYATGAAF